MERRRKWLSPKEENWFCHNLTTATNVHAKEEHVLPHVTRAAYERITFISL
jgi:hypothetical protein